MKSTEIKIGGSVGRAGGELWLADGSIQQRRAGQPHKFSSLAHAVVLLKDSLQLSMKGRSYYSLDVGTKAKS